MTVTVQYSIVQFSIIQYSTAECKGWTFVQGMPQGAGLEGHGGFDNGF